MPNLKSIAQPKISKFNVDIWAQNLGNKLIRQFATTFVSYNFSIYLVKFGVLLKSDF